MTTTQASWADRRDSTRVPVEMLVRSYDQAMFEACEGDISLGGARIVLAQLPKDNQVEVLLHIGGNWGQIRLQGDILSVRDLGGRFEARVSFVEWDTMDELALAKLITYLEQDYEPWSADTELV